MTAPAEPTLGPSDAPLSAHVQVVLTMVATLDEHSQAEIYRALSAQLHPAPPARDERLRLLLPLARMLELWEQHGGHFHQPRMRRSRRTQEDGSKALPKLPWPQVPVIDREVYDRERPSGSPTSKILVTAFGGKRSGGWLMVCRAAWGLLEDGRYRGVGRPRPVHRMADRGLRIWDAETCAKAVRDCALAIGRMPSSTDYQTYQRIRAKRITTDGRVSAGLPTVQTVQNHLGKWRYVLKKARILDEDLITARKTWAVEREPDVDVGDSVIDRLAALDDTDLLHAGISAKKRDALVQKGARPNGHGVRGLERLTLSQAVQLASTLHGSPEWLLGMGPLPGAPCDPNTRLDIPALRSLIDKRGLKHTNIRASLKLTESQWRAVIGERREVTVAEIETLSGILGIQLGVLLTA